MRVVFGAAAVGILLAGYTVCPDHVRTSVTDAVMPGQQTLEDMQDGVDTLVAFFSGPENIQPETPPT